MVRTENLGIEVDETKRETWVPVGPKYYLLLKKWWDNFGLVGNGMMIGARDSIWKKSHEKLKKLYPTVGEIFSVDMYGDCDLVWDITLPIEKFHNKTVIDGLNINWIVCQSTFEHIDDPMSAMKNLMAVLKEQGLLYLHTCGPGVEEHKYPIDCYRFLRDSLIAFANKTESKIEDILWTEKYCYAVYRKMEVY